MFFFLLFFYWRIISLRCCFSSCWTTKWISYMYAHVPSFLSLPPTTTPHFPIPPLQVIREQQAELHVLYARCPLASCFTHGTLSVRLILPFPHCVTYPFSTSASLFPGEFFFKHPYWLSLHRGSHSVGLGSGPNMGTCFKSSQVFQPTANWRAMKHREGAAEFKPVGRERLTELVMFVQDLRRLCEIGGSSLE